MAYVFYNPNPSKKLVGDCVIRGISKLTNQDWKDVHVELCLQSYVMDDIPSSNAVWGALLFKRGYRQHVIPDTCPECMTVRRFCAEHPKGKYLLATGTHVICCDSGIGSIRGTAATKRLFSIGRKEKSNGSKL